MTVPAWMLPGVEPRSSRMWLVALRTETFRLHTHHVVTEVIIHYTRHGNACTSATAVFAVHGT